MLAKDFVVRRIEAMRPQVQVSTDDLLDALLAGVKPVDLVSQFTLPLPSRIGTALT